VREWGEREVGYFEDVDVGEGGADGEGLHDGAPSHGVVLEVGDPVEAVQERLLLRTAAPIAAGLGLVCSHDTTRHAPHDTTRHAPHTQHDTQ
jgi:hypothetical protein